MTTDETEPLDEGARPAPGERAEAARGPTEAPVQDLPVDPHRTARLRLARNLGLALVGVLLVAWLVPRALRAFSTVSTDDAYVNGHVTFVAPRIAGQVERVLVDDDNRVRKGDLLLQLDEEPYRVRVGIAEAALGAAQADLAAEQARARGLAGEARSLRFNLQKAMEGVNDRVALLMAKVATLQSKQATLARAQADYERAEALVKAGVASHQQYDTAHEAVRVAQAEVQEAREGVSQVRVSLGLPAAPPHGADLTQVPADLDQKFSAVKEAQGKLMQVASELGVVQSFDSTPQEMLDTFYRRDPEGDVNRILEQLVANAPAVKQAEAKVLEAQRSVDDARLQQSYCNVVAAIDGVVTRRNVNPGDHVVAGQGVMAVRSLTEIWVDANFKETQLADLRIGQPVDVDVDMYGSAKRFQGRISGFTMGTGSTLAILPPQNATGNFVKVVQRLPVRIDLVDYDPDETPLFIGLSVTPHVRIHETPSGPNAGRILQPPLDLPVASAPPATAAPAAETAP